MGTSPGHLPCVLRAGISRVLTPDNLLVAEWQASVPPGEAIPGHFSEARGHSPGWRVRAPGEISPGCRALSVFTFMDHTTRVTFGSWLGGDRGIRTVLAVAVLCVGAAVAVWGAQQDGSPSTTTAVAKPGTVNEKVAEPATLDDVSQADVNSDISGDVQSLDVSAGDYVYADETLAATDPYSDEASLYQESLALNQDESQLASDESDQMLLFAKAEVATDEQGVSTDQAASTQAQEALAALQAQDQATLHQDESALAQAEQNFGS